MADIYQNYIDTFDDKKLHYGCKLAMNGNISADALLEGFYLLTQNYNDTSEELLEKEGTKLKNLHFLVVPKECEENKKASFYADGIMWIAEKDEEYSGEKVESELSRVIREAEEL